MQNAYTHTAHLDGVPSRLGSGHGSNTGNRRNRTQRQRGEGAPHKAPEGSTTGLLERPARRSEADQLEDRRDGISHLLSREEGLISDAGERGMAYEVQNNSWTSGSDSSEQEDPARSRRAQRVGNKRHKPKKRRRGSGHVRACQQVTDSVSVHGCAGLDSTESSDTGDSDQLIELSVNPIPRSREKDLQAVREYNTLCDRTDPIEWLLMYKDYSCSRGWTEQQYCHMLPLVWGVDDGGIARRWHDSLAVECRRSAGRLGRAFVLKFASRTDKKRHVKEVMVDYQPRGASCADWFLRVSSRFKCLRQWGVCADFSEQQFIGRVIQRFSNRWVRIVMNGRGISGYDYDESSDCSHILRMCQVADWETQRDLDLANWDVDAPASTSRSSNQSGDEKDDLLHDKKVDSVDISPGECVSRRRTGTRRHQSDARVAGQSLGGELRGETESLPAADLHQCCEVNLQAVGLELLSTTTSRRVPFVEGQRHDVEQDGGSVHVSTDESMDGSMDEMGGAMDGPDEEGSKDASMYQQNELKSGAASGCSCYFVHDGGCSHVPCGKNRAKIPILLNGRGALPQHAWSAQARLSPLQIKAAYAEVDRKGLTTRVSQQELRRLVTSPDFENYGLVPNVLACRGNVSLLKNRLGRRAKVVPPEVLAFARKAFYYKLTTLDLELIRTTVWYAKFLASLKSYWPPDVTDCIVLDMCLRAIGCVRYNECPEALRAEFLRRLRGGCLSKAVVVRGWNVVQEFKADNEHGA